MDGIVKNHHRTVGSGEARFVSLGRANVVTSPVHSVIQVNQRQSIIQTSTQEGTMLTKSNVTLLSEPNSVLQTTQRNLRTLQPLQVVVKAGNNESLLAIKNNPKKEQHLTPSYQKFINNIAGIKVKSAGLDYNSNLNSKLSSNSLSAHHQSAVFPSNAIQLNSQGEMHSKPTSVMLNAMSTDGTVLQYESQDGQYFVPVSPSASIQLNGQSKMHSMPTLTMSNATSTDGTILQYASQDGQFLIPVTVGGNSILSTSSIGSEEQDKKHKMRLLRNKEASRKSRQKKKDYDNWLENRVSILENQYKALIVELKMLKELCSKTE